MRGMGWRFVLGALVGCSSGPISIGDDDVPSCSAAECGEAPADAIMCLNGSAGGFACERDAGGTCTWVAWCLVVSCSWEDCGPPPMVPPMCLTEGAPGAAWACESVGSPCSWHAVCPEQMRDCSPMDCEPLSMGATVCAMGDTQGSSCLRDAVGSCRWTPVACRPP